MGLLKRSRSTRCVWLGTGSKTTKRGAEIESRGQSVAAYPSLRWPSRVSATPSHTSKDRSGNPGAPITRRGRAPLTAVLAAGGIQL